MNKPFYTTIIPTFLDQLDSMLNQFVFQGYSALTDHLRAPLGAAIVLTIVILGISITQGWVKLSMGNFVKLTLKIGLIYTFAMNWSVFSEYVAKGITVSAGDVGDWLLASVPHAGAGSGSGINEALQLALTQFMKLGDNLWGLASWHHWEPYLCAILIWGFGCAFIFMAIFEVVLAKIMIALLFTTAPLFIGFTLFKPTYDFFDRWLGLIAGNAFLFIFISALLGLILNFVEWSMIDASTDLSTLNMAGLVPSLFVCFIGLGLVSHVTRMAHSLGGAVTSASGNALVAGAIGGAIVGSKMAAKPLGAIGRGIANSFKISAGK